METGYRLYDCGICDCLHPWNWRGDCRDDANRYMDEDDYIERSGLAEDTKIAVSSMDERIDANREEE